MNNQIEQFINTRGFFNSTETKKEKKSIFEYGYLIEGMSNIFSYRSKTEGKIGIGKIPKRLFKTLNNVCTEYKKLVPDENASTYHTWYGDLPEKLRNEVKVIQDDYFWHELCDDEDKCIYINASEMDELYYSNPKNNLKKINLYGASGNYNIHKDCIFNFDGIKFYRVLIGLTDGNDNIITYFNNIDVGHKLNKTDYIIFDFDKSSHQVIKEKDQMTPRILLKIHFIVCENCKYNRSYVELIKQFYLKYEFITRYFMQVGTDPRTFYQFYIGTFCQNYMNQNFSKILSLVLISIILFLNKGMEIPIDMKNSIHIILYTIILLLFIQSIIATYYYSKFLLLGAK